MPVDSKNSLVTTKVIIPKVNNTCILNPLKTILKVNGLDDYVKLFLFSKQIK